MVERQFKRAMGSAAYKIAPFAMLMESKLITLLSDGMLETTTGNSDGEYQYHLFTMETAIRDSDLIQIGETLQDYRMIKKLKKNKKH